MKVLTKSEINEVNGGLAFILLVPAVLKGIGAGIAAGTALLGLAIAARTL